MSSLVHNDLVRIANVCCVVQSSLPKLSIPLGIYALVQVHQYSILLSDRTIKYTLHVAMCTQ